MAELALAIAGVALTWNNILDFGRLIMDLLGDDDWERRGLLYNLRTKDFLLKEWGDYYGLDREDGQFHRFEPQRKEFLLKVIFRLHDSRVKACKILRERYSLSVDEGEDDCYDDDDGPDLSRKATGFARMIDKAKKLSKKTRDKGAWLAHDHRMVRELINDADEQYGHLRALTFESVHFIMSIVRSEGPAQTLHNSLVALETRARQENRKEIDHLRRTPNSPAEEKDLEWGRETAVNYATQTIASCDQAERVRDLVQKLGGDMVDQRHFSFPEDAGGSTPSGAENLQTAINAFEGLVNQFVLRTGQRLLILIDGLDDLVDMRTDEPIWSSIRLFLRSLASLCSNRVTGDPGVKVLLGCKGTATVVSEYVQDTEVLNVMDRAKRKGNIIEVLAEKW